MDATYSLPKRLIPIPVDIPQLENILVHAQKTYHTAITKLFWESIPKGMLAVAKYNSGALRALRSELLPDLKNLEARVQLPHRLNGDHLYSGTLYIVGTVVCDNMDVDVLQALKADQSDLELRFIASTIVYDNKTASEPIKQKETLNRCGLDVGRYGVIRNASLASVVENLRPLCERENNSATSGIVVRIIDSGSRVRVTACMGKHSWIIRLSSNGNNIKDTIVPTMPPKPIVASTHILVPGKYALLGNFTDAKSVLKQKLSKANCKITTRVVPGCVGAFIGTGANSSDLNNIRRYDIAVMDNRVLSSL